MNIEIDEKDIKKQLDIEISDITRRAVSKIVQNWRFEEEVMKIAKGMIDESISSAVAEQMKNIDEIKELVHAQMVKSIKSKLDRAMKIKTEAAL